MDAFSLLALLGKLLVYLATANAISVALFPWSKKATNINNEINQYYLISLVVGFIGTLLFFLAQVGMFADEGLIGILDLFMISMVWSSAIGDSTLLRLIAITSLLLLMIVKVKFSNRSTSYRYATKSLDVIALSVLVVSYTSVGHIAEKDLFTKVSLMLHIVAMSLWIGALYPLFLACRKSRGENIFVLMDYFGRVAITYLLVLISTGMFMFYEVSGGIEKMLFSSYGQIFLVKLSIVGIILMIAAYHKWLLVPSIQHNNENIYKLQKSLKVEGGIAWLIFIVTSIFTTLISPIH